MDDRHLDQSDTAEATTEKDRERTDIELHRPSSFRHLPIPSSRHPNIHIQTVLTLQILRLRRRIGTFQTSRVVLVHRLRTDGTERGVITGLPDLVAEGEAPGQRLRFLPSQGACWWKGIWHAGVAVVYWLSGLGVRELDAAKTALGCPQSGG